MGMSHTSVSERKRTQRRLTRRQEKQELIRTAEEQIREAAEDLRDAEAVLLDLLFEEDYSELFDTMLRDERKQVLEGFDPHRHESIVSLERFDELISNYISDLGPLTLEESRQRTNVRIVIEDMQLANV